MIKILGASQPFLIGELSPRTAELRSACLTAQGAVVPKMHAPGGLPKTAESLNSQTLYHEPMIRSREF